MDLETVRTVLTNDVNQISVCSDEKRDAGVFYTLIAVKDAEIQRQLVQLIATTGLFLSNSDYLGSFTYQGALNLVFRFQPENRLANCEALYATSFAKRRELAVGLVAAAAATGITGAVGRLLLDERNVNLSPEGEIYFNYFLDFAQLDARDEQAAFFRDLATDAFDILSREYSVRFDRQVDYYPSELQVLYRKAQERGFGGFNQLLTFLKLLPDTPDERHFGVRKAFDRLGGVRRFLARHSMAIFLAAIVAATVAYAGWQITSRLGQRSSVRENTTYIGMETIGEVSLGEEDV